MRNFIATTFLFLFSLFSFSSFATTYYLSSSNGNDNNSGTDPSSAWQSLNKLNSFSNLQPGDNVLFLRGDTFYGTIIVNSGANNVTFGAYGSGSKPVITGFTSVTSWTNLGGNIWESTNAVSQLATANTVVVNGVNTAMGRYPNSGYLTYQSHDGNSSITSNAVDGSTNWSGATIAIKKENYYIETGTITNQWGTTIAFSDPGLYTPTDGFGFFIENDPRTLDVQNEWYYNPSTQKLRIYSTYSPGNVQIATVDELFSNSANNSNVTISDLSFVGANSNMINFYYSNNAVVRNCDLSFGGINGINVDGSYADIESNNITDIGGTGIYIYKSNAIIKNNNVSRIGLIAGNARKDADAGIYSNSDNALIQGNTLNTLGHAGIIFYGNNSVVKNNFINYSCLVLDDVGGIYTHGGSGQQIIGNIVLNSIGDPSGTTDPTDVLAHGIFLDDLSNGITISNNTVYGCRGVGIDLHRAANVTITGNTCFNNGVKNSWMKGALMFQCDPRTAFTGINVNNNILFAKTLDQLAIFYYQDPSVSQSTLTGFGSTDYNYYARPINPSGLLLQNYNYYDLSGWQSFCGQDSHSMTAPKTITDTNDLRFEYNATSSPKTISLDANYIDVKNVSYNGSITLQPFTSAVLIRNGARTSNQAPVANVGSDRVIQLPKNSIVLPGSGTDADGTIVSYSWTQISGPSTASLGNTNSAQGEADNLVQGNYVFRLTVTDNMGATGTADLNVTVQSATQIASPNTPPVVNVGTDRTITLPKNSIVLPGSAVDADGNITSYSWTEVSGPSDATLSNTTSAQAGADNLVAGVYQFKLTVTDNQGATSSATLNVTVNSSNSNSNIPPVANVGSDRSIYLPKDNIVLPGSGSDVDGSVVSYSWNQISGPSSATLINPSWASAGVSGLTEGQYQFQLTVTDNQGATGSAVLNVMVNSANSSNFVLVNVGTDRVIYLPKNGIVLPGSASDPHGTIVSYAWNQISGPSSATLINSTSAQAGADDLIAGNYQFQLTATDDQGATGSAILNVSVQNGANQARMMTSSSSNNSADSSTVSSNLNMETIGKDSVIAIKPVSTEIASGSSQISIYPNPAHDLINLQVSSSSISPDAAVIISDVNGRTVYKKALGTTSSGVQQIDISELKAGTYILTVMFNDKDIKSAKLLKL